MTKIIAVLSGGFSHEREVSLMSGKAVKKALDTLPYDTVEIDVGKDIAKKLEDISPDLAFIALHGPYGEDGCIQGLLEILGIKYTHSGVMASAIAMNKAISKHIFQSLNVDTPKGYVISREDVLENNIKIDYPYVLKPINEGSSIGVHVIFSHEDYLKLKDDYYKQNSYLSSQCLMHNCINIEFLEQTAQEWCHPSAPTLGSSRLLPENSFQFFVGPEENKCIMDSSVKRWNDTLKGGRYDAIPVFDTGMISAVNVSDKNIIMKEMIIEEYIPGIELHTAVLLNEAIGTIEIRPKNKFYDYEAKYKNGFAEHIFPPEIPNDIYKKTLEYARKVHQFLGCKTISRSDFRYNPQNGTLKMLEINTHPGFTELSLVPEIAKLTKGIDFNKLVQIIVEDSLQ